MRVGLDGAVPAATQARETSLGEHPTPGGCSPQLPENGGEGGI